MSIETRLDRLEKSVESEQRMYAILEEARARPGCFSISTRPHLSSSKTRVE
jgi:hypothetical protein